MSSKHIETARVFTRIMDNQFSFLGIRLGLDNILGLVPGAGDILSMVLSLYLVYIGIKLKIPGKKLLQMVFNIFADALIGIIPVAGDIADIFFQGNSKNLQILEEFKDKTP